MPRTSCRGFASCPTVITRDAPAGGARGVAGRKMELGAVVSNPNYHNHDNESGFKGINTMEWVLLPEPMLSRMPRTVWAF